jgi:hypothetical protein
MASAQIGFSSTISEALLFVRSFKAILSGAVSLPIISALMADVRGVGSELQGPPKRFLKM